MMSLPGLRSAAALSKVLLAPDELRIFLPLLVVDVAPLTPRACALIMLVRQNEFRD